MMHNLLYVNLIYFNIKLAFAQFSFKFGSSIVYDLF